MGVNAEGTVTIEFPVANASLGLIVSDGVQQPLAYY